MEDGMYKVIFVDDEPYISTGLDMLLDWEKYGIEKAGNAEDGEEALKLIYELQPDIVITDICMPYLSGLELIKRCNAELKKIPKFLMLTGYGELEYIKQAMRLGAAGYLLKPIDRRELKEHIERIIGELELERKNGAGAAEQLSLADGSMESLRHTAETLENDKKISIDISAANDCIKYGRLDDAQKEIHLMSDRLRESGASMRRVCGCASVLMVSLYRYSERAGAALEAKFNEAIVRVSEAKTINETEKVLDGIIRLVKQELAGKTEANDIANIMDYIEENYRKDISMVEIGKEFCLRTAEVSRLIKAATGMKFNEYINKLRICETCRLLSSTDRNINDIMSELGYKDYFYFTKKFKKFTGCLPSQYRKRVRGE